MTLDGIPVGTLRSNMADTKVTAEQWCKAFGHKWTMSNGETYCKGCFITLDEANRTYYEQNRSTCESAEMRVSEQG